MQIREIPYIVTSSRLLVSAGFEVPGKCPVPIAFLKSFEKQCNRIRRKLKTQFTECSYAEIEDALSFAIELMLNKGVYCENEIAARSWVLRTSAYYLKNELRKCRRCKRCGIEAALSLAVPASDEALTNRDLYASLVRELPLKDQRLIHDRFVLGKTLARIATDLGVTEETVKSRSKRVMLQLRKICARINREA